MKAVPPFPTTELTIKGWPDELIDRFGHDACSGYVERYWLGVLGPTATWILRRLSVGLASTPEGFVVDLQELAGEVGIGLHGGRNSPFIKALGRLCQFELAQLHPGGVLAVRLRVPSLGRRHLSRLPNNLQIHHAAWERDQLVTGDHWSRMQ